MLLFEVFIGLYVFNSEITRKWAGTWVAVEIQNCPEAICLVA